jgi:hypothetical protein
MRAVLFLLLILAVIVFLSFYGSSLRPYWEGRLPRVVSHLGDGALRDAARAMVEEGEESLPSTIEVKTSPGDPATPDTCGQGGAATAGDE